MNYLPLGRVGATYLGEGRSRFLVWAPRCECVTLEIEEPRPRQLVMHEAPGGYFRIEVDDAGPGTRYCYRLDNGPPRPDPASRYQPDGIHQASAVVAEDFPWTDQAWTGLPLADYIIYEIHVGTLTEEGTFDAAAGQLDRLAELGITALELMPVAQFPGARNWGYDGVHLFAPQNTYGGPDGLRRLVDACHARGMAVVMDVVYNHLGPEGNYLREFGDYFTARYQVPWGEAVNVDGPHSDGVRRFLLENALFWFTECHVDALRLDSAHLVFDSSARPFWREMSDVVRRESQRLGRRLYLTAEMTQNDVRYVEPAVVGGYELDAIWNDDFHHALQGYLAGDCGGYYDDFQGVAPIAKALREGFVTTGQYSHYRGRRHGVSSAHVPAAKFIVYAQNHDQVGNRAGSERLAGLVGFEELKLAAGFVLLSPYIPLLFMGEEYGERAPFRFFVDFLDPALNEAVRRGRLREFARFGWQGTMPVPDDVNTFLESRINPALRHEGQHRVLYELHRELIGLRRSLPALRRLDKQQMEVASAPETGWIHLRRWADDVETAAIFHFGAEPAEVALPAATGASRKLLDSADPRWLGPGVTAPDYIEGASRTVRLPPKSFVLYGVGPAF